MQLLITIKQPFRVWVSVVSTASAFVVKSEHNIVEANITHEGEIPQWSGPYTGSRAKPFNSHTVPISSPSKPSGTSPSGCGWSIHRGFR